MGRDDDDPSFGGGGLRSGLRGGPTIWDMLCRTAHAVPSALQESDGTLHN